MTCILSLSWRKLALGEEVAQENNVQGVGGQKDAFSVHQGILDCSYGAPKLCSSMCLRAHFWWRIKALYCTCSPVAATAMQYADPGLHNHKDFISFVC